MDRWLAEDKAFHMAGSFMATTILMLAMPWYIAAIGVTLCGGYVEAWQEKTGRDHASWKDLVANTVGIALAIIVRR
jgi:hypothetical protein